MIPAYLSPWVLFGSGSFVWIAGIIATIQKRNANLLNLLLSRKFRNRYITSRNGYTDHKHIGSIAWDEGSESGAHRLVDTWGTNNSLIVDDVQGF